MISITNYLKLLAVFLFYCTIKSDNFGTDDRLEAFLIKIHHDPKVKYCDHDKNKLMPMCKECIPGMEVGTDGKCSKFIEASMDIRNEIGRLTLERYGGLKDGNRIEPKKPFGLYPYLESPDFLMRQKVFGEKLSLTHAKHIVDIGAYYNPIHLFLRYKHSCPTSVLVIEPILDPLSALVPCPSGDRYTHLVHLPITFKYYMTIKSRFPDPDKVVCIGCDSHYGPNKRMLETTFVRPYTLLFEYPADYIHNKPYHKMTGAGLGENLTAVHRFTVNTTDTQYTKRVMKIIEYH